MQSILTALTTYSICTKKSQQVFTKLVDCMVPVVGLEPTRGISPTDFESVTSTNSITPASAEDIMPQARSAVVAYAV